MRCKPLPAARGAGLMEMAQALRRIVGALQAALAARGARHRGIGLLVAAMWNRLGRVVTRFDALVARLAAGRAARRPSVRGARPPAAASESRSAPASGRVRVRVPREAAWMARMMQEALWCRSQLEAWMAQPEVAALLAVEPAAMRLLRPLCRMLGLEMPAAPVGATGTVAGATGARERQVAGGGFGPAAPRRASMRARKPPWYVCEPWHAP